MAHIQTFKLNKINSWTNHRSSRN